MKTKNGNKVNILLIAITLLLLFVVGINSFGKTNSWLVDQDIIGINVHVGKIKLIISQNGQEIEDDGYISLGAEIIEAGKTYLTDTRNTVNGVTTGEDNRVVILNDEKGAGYYIRFQVIAMVNGVAYNINECIESDFYNRQVANEGYWLYSVDDKTAQTPVNRAINSKETLVLIEDLEFSQSFVDLVQGQYFRLHLYIEGSADGNFV